MKRRNFVKNVSAASAAISIVPSHVLGKTHVPPSDTLYVAAIGIGGRGASVVHGLKETGKVKFVALCDADDRRVESTYKRFDNSAAYFKMLKETPRYRDFRKVYDNHLSEIDGIMVGTPDHTHATISLPFMKAGKHAYVEKPLTHNIREARIMSQVAKENNLVTQMGNQGASSDGSRQAKEWIDAGVIGTIERVDCWTNRPVWPQGLPVPTEKHEVPEGLDWDVWLGPAAMRDFNENYLPFKWRGWWDFGTGALGDMGCHIIETPFGVLGLGYPTEAEASCTANWIGDFQEANYSESFPSSSIVRLKFDHEKHGKIALNWYDGGIMPDLPDELKDGETIGGRGGGSIFYGSKGILVCDLYSENARLVPSDRMESFEAPEPYLKRIKGSTGGHMANWVEGCINGTPTSSSFDRSGPLTEAVLMGNLAIRAFQYKVKRRNGYGFEYPGRKKILWDGDAMQVKNYDLANEWVKGTYRKGWELP